MNDFLVEVRASYNEYLIRVIEGCNEITENINLNNINEVMKLITDFSEGVKWLVDVNSKLEELGYKNGLNYESINEFLNEINLGIASEDFVLVSDIFEYEIKPYFEKCNPYKIQA